MRNTLFATLVMATWATWAQPALASPHVWDQRWDVTGRPDVHVVAEDAHVRIHAGPAGRVSAHVEYELKRWGVIFGSSEPVVVFERKDDQIWIRLHDPKCIGVIGGVDEHFVADVTVPDGVQLAVRTHDGATDCEPLTGRFTFEAGDGAVRAHGLKGDIVVSAADGRVTLDDIDGRLRAHTQDGHLSAAGRFDALDLATADGRLDAFAGAGSRLATAWSVETGDGSVSLRIPHDLAALLDARTRDGHINVELPIEVRGRLVHRELVGELNGGGPALRVRTGDGSITLALSD